MRRFSFLARVPLGHGPAIPRAAQSVRAVLLGLAVGISQLFKYNGWTSGVIVALSSAVWLFSIVASASRSDGCATWGWGLFAAIVAAAVYWPWFEFVDSHGGYRALLAHQRSYLGGLSSWPRYFSQQLAQATTLAWRSSLARERRPGSRIGHVDQHRGFHADYRLLAQSARSSRSLSRPLRDHRALVVGRSGVGRLCCCCGTDGLENKSVLIALRRLGGHVRA